MIKNVFHNVIKNWYLYLIAIIASTLCMVLLTNFINKPRNEETISLFVASTSLKSGTLNQELSKNKPSYLREIDTHMAVYYDSDFDYLYTSLGKEVCDLIILPESKLFDNVITYYYCELDTEYVSSYIDSPQYYISSEESKPYGIKIREKGDISNTIIDFSKETYDEDYYAFFYKKSLHAGKNNLTAWNTSMEFVKIIKEYKQ